MLLQRGIQDGHMPDKQGQFVCTVARQGAAMLGVVMVHTMMLQAEREAGRILFQLVENQPFGAQAAYIMLLAVRSDRRREGIASDLVFHGVSKLAMANSDICAVSSRDILT